ncbi:MAG: type II toxin-antitoxin system HicA family toxin [Nitrososphaera sp.]|nr:type II toxin-antitoxin system HicA family toxin [Nitrososphaera sp.]
MKVVSGKQLCKVWKSKGWKLKRIQGSHHIYTHPDNPTILTVPVHSGRDLKKGTLGQLLKEAGITEKDL